MPKFSPNTWMVDSELGGAFWGLTAVMETRSYEKDATAVWDSSEMPKVTSLPSPQPAGTEQEIMLSDVHTVLRQAVPPIRISGVLSTIPKSLPNI
eukprot:1336039-Rhodomonas_salina.1